MAGRKCTICNHPKRNEIDKSLAVDGAVLRAIAVRYRVSKDSLKRHMDNGHIAEKIQKATQIQEIVEADDLLSQIMNAKKEIREIRKEARNRTFKPKDGEPILDPDNELALKTFDKEAKFLEIEGKVVGAFRDKIEHSGPGGGPMEVTGDISAEAATLIKQLYRTRQI